MRRLLAVALLVATGAAQAAPAPRDGYARVPGASFRSVMPADKARGPVTVADFRLARTPVTNREFLEFVRRQPQWQRGAAPALFADAGYLRH